MIIRNETKNSTASDIYIERLIHLGKNTKSDKLDVAKLRLLDTLSVAIAGASELQQRLLRISEQLNPQAGPIPIYGLSRGGDLLTSALLNATSAHHLELDDGSRFGMVHPGACIIPALLALAKNEAICGEMLLRGIVVGYEAVIRLATALQPGLRQRGFHATGACGAIGVAMAAAEALQLDKHQRAAALAAAATQSAGVLEVIRDGSDLKPFNAGQAALHGVLAIVMARAGYQPPRDVLMGPQGLMQALSPSMDLEALLEIDTEHPAMEMTYVKPFAACRHCHGPIELALTLRQAHSITAKQIHSVRVRTYAQGLHLHDHCRVQSENEARMSTPYSVAVALCTGRASLESFSEQQLNNRAVQQLMTRVEMKEDPQRTAKVPRERGSELTLRLADGRQVRAAVELPLGEPERPLDGSALQTKARSMLNYAGWNADAANNLLDAVDRLHEDSNLLLECLQR